MKSEDPDQDGSYWRLRDVRRIRRRSSSSFQLLATLAAQKGAESVDFAVSGKVIGFCLGGEASCSVFRTAYCLGSVAQGEISQMLASCTLQAPSTCQNACS